MTDDKPIRIVRTPHSKDRPYFSMARATAQDNGISYEALGLLTYLLSKPDSWEINIKDVAKRSTKYKAYKMLRELRKAGYMKLEKEKGTGRFGQWVYQIFETCQLIEFQQVENQVVENQHTQYVQSNSAESTKKDKSADAPPPIKFPRSINSYTAEHVLAYQSQHTADMKALIHAWDGDMFNSITEFTTKIGRLYIETHMELSRLNKPCTEYLAIANHTKKKDAWKDGHKVTDMLLHLTDYKSPASKIVYDDPAMDLNIPQPNILSVFQQRELERKARENHG